MVFDSEKEVNSLVKHELGNILQVSEAVLSTEGYKDEYLQDDGYQEAMEEFSGVLDAAVSRLGSSYDLSLAEDDLSYITGFDPENFHEDFRYNVEKAINLAEVAESYIEETEGDKAGWISIEDIFHSYDGEFDLDGCGNVNLRGDSSLNCVLSTLEDNTYRHGGKEVTPQIKVQKQGKESGEYALDHWNNAQKEEYVDHWLKEASDDTYNLLFWDDGDGLDPEYQDNPERIFAKGEGDNSGMGLHLSKRIIESFGGDIEVLETHADIPEDAGMKMAITLPGTTRNLRHLSL